VSHGRGLLRSPAVHFLMLGGLLFFGQRMLAPRLAAWSAASTRADGGRLTTDEILYRDAVAIGLDRTDPLVRSRLAKLGELIATDDVEDAGQLEQAARRLGLDRSDLVVHRHLAHVMKLALSHIGPSEWPTEQDLVAYYERHEDAYVEPARYRVEHVFFARDRSGVPARRAAADALRTLRAGDGATAHGGVAGDTFLLGATLTMSAPELARRLGPTFAAAVDEAPIGRWFGPVASSYGEHVVRVSEKTPAEVPPLEAVRGRVVQALLAELSAAKLQRRLSERRAAYGG
jgi:peptidyl-prolyl cis-trans isomerase C